MLTRIFAVSAKLGASKVTRGQMDEVFLHFGLVKPRADLALQYQYLHLGCRIALSCPGQVLWRPFRCAVYFGSLRRCGASPKWLCILTNKPTRRDHARVHDGHGNVLYARRAGETSRLLVYVASLGSISALNDCSFDEWLCYHLSWVRELWRFAYQGMIVTTPLFHSLFV